MTERPSPDEPAGTEAHALRETTLVTSLGRGRDLRELRGVLIDAGHAASGGAASPTRLRPIGDALELGRRPEGPNVWLFNDRRTSSRHARIERRGDRYVVVDLGSTNGTLVDGRRVTEPVPLDSGSVVFFGGQAAVFRWMTADDEEALDDEKARPFGPVATASPPMVASLLRLRRLARTSEGVLITGETGVGKEVYARALHAASGRSGPCLAINCAALPPELVESELFGYVRGAHSQASQSKPGLIEQADRGTLLLDEIGELPDIGQAKLLRFLQTGEFFPLGATTPRRVDVRVVAATNRGTSTHPALRADLLARLGSEPIVLPPLRHRPEDVGPLAAHFAEQQGGVRPFDTGAFLAMLLHRWPMNVRELERMVREARAATPEGLAIGLGALPRSVVERVSAVDGDEATAPLADAGREGRQPRPTQEVLEALLAEHRGNVAAVARALGRQQAVVWRTLGRYGIDVSRFRD